jgi:hypothetical protein
VHTGLRILCLLALFGFAHVKGIENRAKAVRPIHLELTSLSGEKQSLQLAATGAHRLADRRPDLDEFRYGRSNSGTRFAEPCSALVLRLYMK